MESKEIHGNRLGKTIYLFIYWVLKKGFWENSGPGFVWGEREFKLMSM